MKHVYHILTNIGRLTCLCILLSLVPTIASAFFCNQSSVSIQWAKHSTFAIDGDNFSRGTFTVIDAGDASLIQFDKMTITDALEAKFEITGLKPGTTNIAVRWEFMDGSDNGICNATVEVTDMIYPYATARQDILDYIGGLGLKETEAWAFMPYRPLCIGSTVESANKEAVNVDLTKDSWFAYIDFSQDIRYGHYGQYVFIDAETGDLTTHDVEWYPVIDGQPYITNTDDRINSNERIYGLAPEPVLEPDASVISEPVSSTTPKTKICAVLASGTADNPRQIESFEQDVDFMKNNLMNESLGPQLTEGDVTVLNNASFKQIKETLESFKGKYSKVYFYYSGHGTERYMVTNDTVGNRMWYVDLAEELEKTEADDVCVILDACHSGGAIESFQENEGLQATNVTLLTSSHKDTTSWTRYIVTGGGDTIRTGEYTWAFVKCFGDPRADADKDNQVTIKEAHRWALERNPTLDVGGTLRGRMDPQCWLHRAPETVEQIIEPLDTRLTLDQGTDEKLPSDADLRIDVRYDTEDTTITDPKVYHISPKVQWDIRLVPDVEDYRIGIKFDYSFAEEDFTGQGEPGVVWRANLGDPWIKYTPTTPDTTAKTVLAFDLTKLGHFAIAEVEPPPSNSVTYSTAQHGFLLDQNTPNPFTLTTRIGYTLPHSADVTVHIIDPLGRRVMTLYQGTQEPGSHSIKWNGRDASGTQLPSGTYHVSLQATSNTYGLVRLARGLVLTR